MSDIDTIMRTTTPSDLFGTNRKQARIRYMRLMRAVHPDTHPDDKRAEEATKHLTMLWGQYTGKVASGNKGTRRPRELSRDDGYVLFEDNGKWLLVSRRTGGEPRAYSSPKTELYASSPITFSDVKARFKMTQSDGVHLATSFTARVASYAKTSSTPYGHASYDRTITYQDISTSEQTFLLDDLVANHVTSLEPEDAIWLMKRVAFVYAVLDTSGCTVRDASMRPIVLPKRHFMVMETQNVEQGTSRLELDRWYANVSHDIITCLGHDARSSKVRRFIRSQSTPTSLISTIDGFSRDTFGGIYFHEMTLA